MVVAALIHRSGRLRLLIHLAGVGGEALAAPRQSGESEFSSQRERASSGLRRTKGTSGASGGGRARRRREGRTGCWVIARGWGCLLPKPQPTGSRERSGRCRQSPPPGQDRRGKCEVLLPPAQQRQAGLFLGRGARRVSGPEPAAASPPPAAPGPDAAPSWPAWTPIPEDQPRLLRI